MPGISLDEAQPAKKRHVAAKLLLEKANRVLEIGSGWAGMAMCLAEAEEVEVTGVMLREEQLKVSRNRAVRPRKFRPADALRHTLRAWRERCVARKAEAIALYDERFLRIWEF